MTSKALTKTYEAGYQAMANDARREADAQEWIEGLNQDALPAMLEDLLDKAAGDESHPAMGLVDIVGDLIADYEAEHHLLPEATGLQALQFLMAQHGLKQADLPEIGSQGVVSEVLAGKRKLNIRQLQALSERFGVSTATFV